MALETAAIVYVAGVDGQTELLPLIGVGIVGTARSIAVTAELFPQLLEAYTLMFPLRNPELMFTVSVSVPCPLVIVIPEGTLQV